MENSPAPERAEMLRRAPDFAAARRRMVQEQLRARGIADRRILDAMGGLPRELFVPPGDDSRAYADGALGIGCGQTISQPYMVALMTQELHLEGTERVLEIGTGSGYQTALLARLAAGVYTVERIAELSERARQVVCEELGCANASFRVGDGSLGWPEEAPFDRFLVTAGAPRRPEGLIEQLAPGGEGLAPVGGRSWQTLIHYSKRADGSVRETAVCDCVFVPLIGADGW